MAVGSRRLALGFAFALSVSLPAPRPLAAAEAPDLLATLEAFDHPTLGEAVNVSGVRLEGPHASFVLESGRAAPVSAGDRIVGLFFEGRGAFDYLSADSIEAPVVVFNAKKGSSLKPEKTADGVRLQDSFKRLLWLAAGKPLPELSGSPAPPLADAFRKHRDKFGRIHAPPLSHDFAIQRIDAPDAPLDLGRARRRPRRSPVRLRRNRRSGGGARDAQLERVDRDAAPPVSLARPAFGAADRPRPPRPAQTALPADGRRRAPPGLRRKRREAHGRGDPGSAGPSGARPAIRRRLDRLCAGGLQPRGALREGPPRDGRERPRPAFRPPARRARRRAGRAGARGAAAQAPLRDRRRLPRAAARRQLLGARDLGLVPRAAAVRSGLHVPRRGARSGPLRAVRAGKDRAAREGGRRRTFSRRGSTRRSSSPSSSRAATTWRRSSATA